MRDTIKFFIITLVMLFLVIGGCNKLFSLRQSSLPRYEVTVIDSSIGTSVEGGLLRHVKQNEVITLTVKVNDDYVFVKTLKLIRKGSIIVIREALPIEGYGWIVEKIKYLAPEKRGKK